MNLTKNSKINSVFEFQQMQKLKNTQLNNVILNKRATNKTLNNKKLRMLIETQTYKYKFLLMCYSQI